MLKGSFVKICSLYLKYSAMLSKIHSYRLLLMILPTGLYVYTFLLYCTILLKERK